MSWTKSIKMLFFFFYFPKCIVRGPVDYSQVELEDLDLDWIHSGLDMDWNGCDHFTSLILEVTRL